MQQYKGKITYKLPDDTFDECEVKGSGELDYYNKVALALTQIQQLYYTNHREFNVSYSGDLVQQIKEMLANPTIFNTQLKAVLDSKTKYGMGIYRKKNKNGF